MGSCGAFCSFCGRCGKTVEGSFAPARPSNVAPPGVSARKAEQGTRPRASTRGVEDGASDGAEGPRNYVRT